MAANVSRSPDAPKISVGSRTPPSVPRPDNPDNIFGAALALLAGCHPARQSTISEARGPTYAQLRATADALGMTAEQCADGELLAESIPLSERRVLHVLGALAEVVA
jgi:hypothetical protein